MPAIYTPLEDGVGEWAGYKRFKRAGDCILSILINEDGECEKAHTHRWGRMYSIDPQMIIMENGVFVKLECGCMQAWSSACLSAGVNISMYRNR